MVAARVTLKSNAILHDHHHRHLESRHPHHYDLPILRITEVNQNRAAPDANCE